MTDDLRERVARAIEQALLTARIDPLTYGPEADAAIAIIRPETLEEAAKAASDYQHPNMALFNHQTGIAAAIRALKRKGESND